MAQPGLERTGGHSDASPAEAVSRGAISRRSAIRIAMAGIVAVTAAPLLSACAGPQAPAPAAAPAKPAAPAPAAPAPGAAPAPAAPAPAKAGPGGFSGGGSLKLLMRTHFIPAYDVWLDKWAAEWGAKNKVEVQIDHILAAEMAAKIAAEVASAAGHDLFGLTRNGEAQLYAKHLVDVTDLAKPIGEANGGWVNPISESIAVNEGVWRAVPEFFIEFSTMYRKDLFDANGLKVPETWEDLLKAGTVLKSKGNPIGISINQKSGDANASWQSILWAYGGSVVEKDGKTVAINSQGTRDALKFGLDLYKSAMTDEVLSWDDTANNQFLASGRGSWIHNPISALRTIEKDKPDLAKNIFVSLPPKGPQGQFAAVSTQQWGIMGYSKNVPAAKAFIADYYTVFMDAYKVSAGYNQPLLKGPRKKPMPILGDDPKLVALQDFDQIARVIGNPGPPTPAAAEVESNWIIPLMVGQAIQTGSVDEAVKWADGKIKAIYDKHK